nr:hypothetical protein [Maliibacterium massiliense]
MSTRRIQMSSAIKPLQGAPQKQAAAAAYKSAYQPRHAKPEPKQTPPSQRPAPQNMPRHAKPSPDTAPQQPDQQASAPQQAAPAPPQHAYRQQEPPAPPRISMEAPPQDMPPQGTPLQDAPPQGPAPLQPGTGFAPPHYAPRSQKSFSALKRVQQEQDRILAAVRGQKKAD